MISLQQLLSRYSFQPTAKMQREVVARVIRDESGITVDQESIYIQEPTAFLRVRPAKRSEILLHQVEIVRALAADSRTKAITRLS